MDDHERGLGEKPLPFHEYIEQFSRPETVFLSNCCGSSPTSLCNEDTGFCPECRDHCEFEDRCIECNETECICPATRTFPDGTIEILEMDYPQPIGDSYVSDFDRITARAGIAIGLMIVVAVGGLMISGVAR